MSNLLDVTAITRVLVNASTGTTVLKAAADGVKYAVMAYDFGLATVAGTLKYLGGTATISGTYSHGTIGSMTAGYNPQGWCMTASGVALNLVVATAGHKVRGIVQVGSVNA